MRFIIRNLLDHIDQADNIATDLRHNLRRTDNDQTVNWRSFYAAKMNTTSDHFFYWWELRRTLQTQARGMYKGGIVLHDYVYALSDGVNQSQEGQQITGRILKYGNDDTKEIHS